MSILTIMFFPKLCQMHKRLILVQLAEHKRAMYQADEPGLACLLWGRPAHEAATMRRTATLKRSSLSLSDMCSLWRDTVAGSSGWRSTACTLNTFA